MAYNKILEDITPTEDHIKAYNENQQFEIEQANRADEWRRKQALNQIFSKHIDDKGNLNERQFYRDASQAGLDPNQIGQAIDYHNKQIEQMSKIATEQPAQRMQGFDPTAAGRNDATYGAPDAGSILPGMQKISSPSAGDVTTAPTADQIAANDALVAGLRNPSEVGAQTVQPEQPAPVAPVAPTAPTTTALDRLKRMSKAQVKEVQRELGFDKKERDGKVGPLTAKRLRAALTVGSVMEGSNLGDLVSGTADEGVKDYADTEGGQVTIHAPFQSKGEEAKMVPDNVGPDVFAPAPEDNRTFTQRFEDSYNPTNAVGAGGAVEFGGADDPMFKWEPTEDNSNEFRTYKTALAAKLNSEGYVDASQKLKTIYLNTYKSNMPTAPNEGLRLLGKEGVAKYMGELKAYQAGLQKAQGLAQAAVNAERESLAKFAKEYGVDTNTSKTHSLDIEAKDADIAGRRKGNAGSGSQLIRTRAVSKEEKEAGDRIGNAYFDFVDGKNLGGFEGAMSMSRATGKADGQFSKETLIADLVAQGAIPTTEARFIKDLLSEGGSTTETEVIKYLKTQYTDAKVDKAKQAKWIATKEANILQSLKDKGYGILKDKPAPKTGNAGDRLKGKAKTTPKTGRSL